MGFAVSIGTRQHQQVGTSAWPKAGMHDLSLLSSADCLMQESKRSMTQPPPRVPPPPAAEPRLASASTKGAAAVARPGLQNEAGEYNCFLNVIIQCLWHCSAFRARLLSCPPHYEHGAALALSSLWSHRFGLIDLPLPQHRSPHICQRAGLKPCSITSHAT